MILIEKTQIMGLEPTIRGMRNPMNSWAKSDSELFNAHGVYFDGCNERWEIDGRAFEIGPNDLDLMLRLARAGSVDGKFRRMIAVYVDITAPLYWWKEFDTYKVGTVANSCSTMHKIHAKEFTLDDFSHEHLDVRCREVLANIYQHRRNHKLDEWREVCRWIESLPYSEIITCNVGKESLG